MGQNEGEGQLLPETLRLADYNVGPDDRTSPSPANSAPASSAGAASSPLKKAAPNPSPSP